MSGLELAAAPKQEGDNAGNGGIGVDVHVGDILWMKKPHPCGENRMEVLRIGMDFRIRCVGCGREVMVPRTKVERHIRQIERKDP